MVYGNGLMENTVCVYVHTEYSNQCVLQIPRKQWPTIFMVMQYVAWDHCIQQYCVYYQKYFVNSEVTVL